MSLGHEQIKQVDVDPWRNVKPDPAWQCLRPSHKRWKCVQISYLSRHPSPRYELMLNDELYQPILVLVQHNKCSIGVTDGESKLWWNSAIEIHVKPERVG